MYKREARCTQDDYVTCSECKLEEIGGGKVWWQARMQLGNITWCSTSMMPLDIKKKNQVLKASIKGWKLKREDCCSEFREELRQALGRSEGLQGN